MSILIADREPAASAAYASAISNLAAVNECSSIGDARTCIQTGRFSLAILGKLGNSGWEAVDFAVEIHSRPGAPDIFLIAGDSSEELAIAALKAGVADYFKQPICSSELADAVKRWIASHHRLVEPLSPEFARIVGDSRSMTELREYVAKVARSDCNVLITGETGTGKELVAELVHSQGPRSRKPFVCINCAAVPDLLLESELFGHERGAYTGAFAAREGRMRHADGGTVFFDEIGEMTLHAQAKILRVIESREVQRLGGTSSIPVDVRIVAATNQMLDDLSERNLFRRDLFFRLNVARIHLPPLRERPEDIPSLIDHFIATFSRKCRHLVKGVARDAMDILMKHPWPGNVRELRNVVEAIFINRPDTLVRIPDLPPSLLEKTSAAGVEPVNDRDQLVDALRMSSWNKSKAAQKLNWSRMTVYRKMAQYGIQSSPRVPPDVEREAAPSTGRRRAQTA